MTNKLKKKWYLEICKLSQKLVLSLSVTFQKQRKLEHLDIFLHLQ